MTQGVTMWLAGLIAGLLIGWLLLPTPLSVCGIYQAESMPAWVQAVGSVFAIFVAAGIPWWQQRIKQQEDFKRLSIATLRLRSNLEALGRAAGERAAQLRMFKVEAATPSAVSSLMNALSLAEVRALENYIDRVHHLEDRIQTPILELMQEYDQLDVDIGRIYGVADSERVGELKRCYSALITRFESVSSFSFKASNAIRVVDEERRYPDIKARNLGGRPSSESAA